MTSETTQPDQELQTIGWREWVGLPDLGLAAIKAKVDTGARTSTLHAFSVEPFQHSDGSEWVRFGMHPEQNSSAAELYCEAPIHDRRIVRDSGGHEEERIIIETRAKLGEQLVDIELTLTSRDNMMFRMLLGRTAMRGRFTVNPARSFVMGRRKRRKVKRPDSQ